MFCFASLLHRYVPFETLCSNIHTMRIFLDVKYKLWFFFFTLRMRIVEGLHSKNINTLFFLMKSVLYMYIIFKNVTTRWIFNGCSVVPQSHYFNAIYCKPFYPPPSQNIDFNEYMFYKNCPQCVVLSRF